jgi:hypothetical protein
MATRRTPLNNCSPWDHGKREGDEVVSELMRIDVFVPYHDSTTGRGDSEGES